MATKTKINLNSSITASFKIDGKWEVYDFIDLLQSVEYLYAFYLAFEIAKNELKDFGISSDNAELKESELVEILSRKHFESAFFHAEYGLIDKFQNSEQRYYNRVGRIGIVKIHYSSPGSIDFLGIGKVLNTIKKVVIYYAPNEHDKEKTRLLKQKRIKKEIDNLKALGLSDVEIQFLILKRDVAFEKIGELNKNSKLKDIELK